MTELNASTARSSSTIGVGSHPLGISSDGTHVWVTNNGGGNSVNELDASTAAVVHTITVGLNPDGISSDGNHVWVTSQNDNTVSEIGINTATLYVSPSGSGTVCSQASPCGSIQTAINTATGGSYPEYYMTIDVATGIYTENDTVDASSLDSLAIVGVGASSTLLNANGSGTVLTITGGTVNINGVTIENGNASDGGGIDACDGSSGCIVDVTSSNFSNNGYNTGGAIDNADNHGQSTLTVSQSDFTDNSAAFGGGAIENGANGGTGSLTVTHSNFSGNSTSSGRGRGHRQR